MASTAVAKAVQASKGVIGVHKKYTVQSVGIWERVRRFLAIEPSRSNGIPLNAQFRNPPPGTNDPHAYTDPVTVPAADIAGNAYWVRDSRRSYSRPSVVSQADVVGLLTGGSKEAPRQKLLGETGAASLMKAGEQGEKGLAAFFREGRATLEKKVDNSVVDFQLSSPPGFLVRNKGADKYQLTEENAYPSEYPCRTFS